MKSSLPSVISLQLKILIFGVLCTPVSSWSQSNQAEPLSLDQSYWSLDSFIESEYIIYEELEIFLDQKGNTSFDEIIKNDHLFSRNTTAEHFQPNAVYWAKLKLRGHSEKTANYFFGLSTEYGQGWLKNELWLVHKDSSYVKQQTGFSLLKKEKSVSSIANLARFEIQQNENVTLYIRYEGVLQDPRRIPTQINIGFNNEDVIPGYIEGYPFKGQFMLTPYAPYNYNKIDNIELYQDQSGKASMEDIAGNWDQLDIINTYNSNLEMDQVYWIKATFFGSPEFNGEQIFSTNFDYNNDFNFIDAYILNRNGNTVHQRTGHHIPLKERPYEFWGNFIKLDINLQDTIDLFIRLEGANPKSYHEDISLIHVDGTSLFPNQVKLAAKSFVFFGALAIQILFFLLLFFVEKDRIHLYFVLYTLGFFLVFGFGPDTAYSFVPFPIWQATHFFLFYLGIFLCTSSLLKFTTAYFHYPKDTIIAKWIVPVFIIVNALVHLNCFVKPHNIPGYIVGGELPFFLVLIMMLLSLVLTIIIAIKAPKQIAISKKVYFLSFSPLMLAALIFVVYIFSANFLLHEPFSLIVMFDILQGSIAIMLVLLAVSIGHRTNKLKEEKESALRKHLSDQKEINAAISRFVPSKFLDALGKSSIMEVAVGNSIEKEVTVLFTDIRGYTTLSEDMTPDETFMFVNAYNGRMGPLIEKNNGFINQYLGDGIMALFPESPLNALRAAVQMQEEIQEYNKQRVQKGQESIVVGMGLHSGSLIMGITGDEYRLDATTISDVVNSASRIENLSKHYGSSILLSESSLKEIGDTEEFNFRYFGPVQVKGKQNALNIYECINGDTPQQKKLKFATLPEFEKAIKHYFGQSFSEALEIMKSILQQNPADKAANLFLSKSERYLKTGVAKDWTGLEEIGKK